MIYLDVTSAAASPANMGVQRTLRGIFSHLAGRREVTPLRWDFRGRCYARLSSREQDFLCHPFAGYRTATGTPGRWDWRHWVEDWRDDRTRPQRRIDNAAVLRAGDVLLIPDLCWDKRIRAWKDWAALPGRKIAIFHDAMPLRIPGQADSHDARFAEYVRELARLDLVICVSREVQDDLLRYWRQFDVAAKPTLVLTWPVPFEETRPVGEPNFAARHIIYVSRLKLRKNHLVLLEACERLWASGESFSLDLIGIADAFTDTHRIVRAMKKLARRGRPVRWRRHISDAELTEAYRDCSFTAFPSRLEGFGLPIIESLWHGRPVICGGNGAIGDVAAGGGCLIVNQNDPAALASGISSLLRDEALYSRLQEETQRRVFRSSRRGRRGMIYLDVTGGCTLPLQTGIPRTTREVHRLFAARRHDLLPIRWQPFRRSYTRLSARAVALLENRLAPPPRPPRDTTGPWLIAALRDLALPWPPSVPLHRRLRATDTLILTSLFPDNRLAGLEKLLARPGRKIAIFHDAIPLRDPLVPEWEKKRHRRALRLLGRFDFVIAVSAAARDDLLALSQENDLPPPSTHVIRWPVPFHPARPAFTPPTGTTVLCVSRLKRVKNHAALLAACELLWREGRVFSIALIGCKDEPRESDAVLAEVRRLTAAGHPITWRAQVAEADLHAAYRDAAFTVFPSLAEGFGLPILESLWHGRGVICSDGGAMGETSRGPGAVHADVTRPEEIAAAMRPLLAHPERGVALAHAAHARPLRGWDDYWRDFEPFLAAA
jgi:glycosyltransferase involved in cell wall biosynthesis